VAFSKAVFVGAVGVGKGEQHNPSIFTIQLFTLSLKDITRVISRSRDRLLEIGVIGNCHTCK